MKTAFVCLIACLFTAQLAAQPGTMDGYHDYLPGLFDAPDGKTLTCAFAKGGADFEFALTRYNPDGSLDKTYTLHAKTAGPFASGAYRCNDLPKALILPDGKILLVAGVSLDGRDSIAIFRFDPDGSPDTGFGRGGAAVLGFNPYYNYPGAVAIDRSGRILIAGTTVEKAYDEAAGESFYEDRLVLARLNPDGAYDRAFGGHGFVQTDIGDMESPFAIALQADGKILTAATIRVYGEEGYEETVVVLRFLGGDAAGEGVVKTEGK